MDQSSIKNYSTIDWHKNDRQCRESEMMETEGSITSVRNVLIILNYMIKLGYDIDYILNVASCYEVGFLL